MGFDLFRFAGLFFSWIHSESGSPYNSADALAKTRDEAEKEQEEAVNAGRNCLYQSLAT